MVARGYVVLPIAADCASCERSAAYPDGGTWLLCCTHPLLCVPGSPVQAWRGEAADLDARGWPEPGATHPPCPCWRSAAGEES